MKNKFIGWALALTQTLLISAPTLAATNVIKLNVSSSDFSSYNSKSKKFVFTNPSASVNGSNFIAAKMETRGQSCIGAVRRCLGLDLSGDVRLFMGVNGEGDDWKVDGMNLVSMVQDLGYINNKIGYLFSKELSFPTVKNTFSEVQMNGNSLGLYLVTQKPHKIAKKMKSPFIGRRREGGSLEIKKYFPGITNISAAQYVDEFDAIYKMIKDHPEHANLYGYLKGKMNIDNYFRLLTLQTLLKSGDYSDEIFFYVVPGKSGTYFDIIPWDFEDLFTTPHPTRANKKAMKKGWFDNSIMYAFEDPLDQAIYKNPTMQNEFKRVAKKMLLTELTDELFVKVITEARGEIAPYLDIPSVLVQSEKDEVYKGERYTKNFILNLLNQRLNEIRARKIELLKKL